MPAPPDTIECRYCGKVTQEYQTVGHIPETFSPQHFIIENILDINGNPLSRDDHVCLCTNKHFVLSICACREVNHLPGHSNRADPDSHQNRAQTSPAHGVILQAQGDTMTL